MPGRDISCVLAWIAQDTNYYLGINEDNCSSLRSSWCGLNNQKEKPNAEQMVCLSFADSKTNASSHSKDFNMHSFCRILLELKDLTFRLNSHQILFGKMMEPGSDAFTSEHILRGKRKWNTDSCMYWNQETSTLVKQTSIWLMCFYIGAPFNAVAFCR